MASKNLKVQKKKQYDPFRTLTIKTEAVGKIKCFIKAIKPNPNDMYGAKKGDGIHYNLQGLCCKQSDFGAEMYDKTRVYYYEVGASDGSYRKCITHEEAQKRFEELIAFEKRQTYIH